MGTSKSSNETVNQAYDNRSITEVLQEYNIDYEVDNSVEYDLDQDIEIDKSVRYEQDIDYREDNDTEIDLDYEVSSVLEYSADQDNDTELNLSANQDNDTEIRLDEGAIYGGQGDITITSTDAGAIEGALGFAGDVLAGYFDGVESVLGSSGKQNAALIENAFKSTVGGIQEQSNNQAKWAGLAVFVMAIVAIFKPR